MRPEDDHFSERATAYAAHRPGYPAALVDWLAERVRHPGLAWDAGCGSGQLSVPLARRFARVVGTDASRQQLARAPTHRRVMYSCATSEASGVGDGIVDLAVAAQAAHWFDLDGYYREVRRVARPGAVVALVTYGPMCLDEDTSSLAERFYTQVAPFWPPERRHVDDRYRSLPFPFDEIEAPKLHIRASWRLEDVLGYVHTWSAVRALVAREGPEPIEVFRRDLAGAWGPLERRRPVRWLLSARVGVVRGGAARKRT